MGSAGLSKPSAWRRHESSSLIVQGLADAGGYYQVSAFGPHLQKEDGNYCSSQEKQGTWEVVEIGWEKKSGSKYPEFSGPGSVPTLPPA